MKPLLLRANDIFKREDPMATLSSLLYRIWNSATFMTWSSFASRSLQIVVLLPLLLTRFTTAEISLWYLFRSIIELQRMGDLGFNVTFARVIAFALGGAQQIKDHRIVEYTNPNTSPNWPLIERIYSTMHTIYLRLSLVALLIGAIVGSWALQKPISMTQDPTSAWIAWAIVIITTLITFQGNTYSAYLQGTNNIALLRRWEAIFALVASITSVSVVLLHGSLLNLIIVQQSWWVINVFRDRWLCKQIQGGRFSSFQLTGIDTEVFKAVWPSAWRSGIGVFMSYGLVQISGILYAQFGSTPGVASYLLALRLIDLIAEIARAPFYSKLPQLAQLRSKGRVTEQVQLARRGMSLAYWAFCIGFLLIGTFSTYLLKVIGSSTQFVPLTLWALMGIAAFLERYGAMHIQLYSTTNHIIWHIANGISGLIYIVTSLLLISTLGIYAFPIGLILGYLGFYVWYSALHSYKAFHLRFWQFEPALSFVPFSCILFYAVVAFSLYI